MTARTHTRLAGVRWLILARFDPDSRGRSAIAWLMDDPVFSGSTPVPTRPGAKPIPSQAA